MQHPVFDTYDIFAINSAVNGCSVYLANSNGEQVAFAKFDRKTKRLAFTASTNPKLPSGIALLETFTDAEFASNMSRGLLNGQSPSAIIIEAAYTFVLTYLVSGLDEPSVETDDFSIVLRAKSGVVVPGTGGASPSSPANPGNPSTPDPASVARGKAGKKPRRRKTNVGIWL